jgi:PAS domain S-box-containing protein
MNDKQPSQCNLIETLPTAFSRHQVVLGDDGSISDYIFLQVNTAFEQMTGLKRDQVIGKKVTEVLPDIEKGEFDWIGICGKVALDGTSLNFEQYSEPLKRWYAVQAYSDEPGYFSTIFNEITAVKQKTSTIRELLKLSEKLIDSGLASFDYQAPVDSMHYLSGAKFVAINTYENNRTKTVTRAIAGLPAAVTIASNALGFDITDRAWEIIPERLRKIEGGKLTRFRSLYETAMGALNETTAFMLQELVGVGDIYVIELAYGGRETMGDIIFFMPKHHDIKNSEEIELYAGQLGSLLARLRIEQDFQLKSKELDRYFNNSLDLLCVANTSGEFIRVNKRWEEILGYSAADIEGRPFLDYVHPDDLSATLETMTTLDNQSEVKNFKNRYLSSDGTYRWIEWRSKPQGNIIYAVARDVTENMKAETELIQQKERLANIVEGANVGTWEWNVQTGETIFNEKWADIIGYTLKEISPISIETWINNTHPDDLEASNKMLEKHLNGKLDHYEIECRMLHKQGHWVWINDRGKVRSWTEDGKPLWVFGTHIDITERKQAEEALQDRERLLATILQTTVDGFWVVDNQKRITQVNDAYCVMSGYSREELLSMTIKDLDAIEIPEETAARIKRIIENGSEIFQTCHRRKNGTLLPLEISITYLAENGGQLICFCRDITIRKQAEKALMLQASERAAVDAFTSSVSHDLQAPLRRIEGFSEALLEECSDQLNEQARDYLRRIIRQIKSMSDRTAALLKLSKIVSHEINYEEVNLSSLARSYLEKLCYAEPNRRVDTVVAPDITAMGDGDFLSVVLENLLDNAWKFTAGLENARIELGSAKKDGLTIYFIRDNGIGFDQQRANEIFEPFIKLHSEADYPGIGIGLNLVYRIIKRHGGEVWAEGEPNKGACFFFTLP